MEDLIKNIAAAIRQTQDRIKQHLPAIEASVNDIIQSNSTDTKAIEHTLDTLLDLQYIGLGRELFFKLLEYYKTIDQAAARDYWDFYEDIGNEES